MRVDLYAAIHKAQRFHMFKLANAIGCADIGNDAALAERVRHLIEHLRDHAQNEEIYIHPLFDRAGSGADSLRHGHEELEADLQEIEHVLGNGRQQDLYATYTRSQALGFYQIIGGQVASESGLPFYPTLLPQRFLSSNSASYLLPGGQRLKQVHTNTRFGTLLIDEMKGASTTLESPNVVVAGEPASLVQVKHRGEKWATVLYVPHGDRLFIVEADRRIDAKDSKGFVDMVEQLVSGAVN